MIKRIMRYIRRKRYQHFVGNLTGGINDLSHRALLYYTTEPFWNSRRLRNYEHTFLWEVLEIVRILNNFGFIVDVVDRSVNDFVPEDIYDIFIGLGAGNSGKHFAKYASQLTRAVKILYAAGPEPEISNKLIEARYEKLAQRTGITAPPMRMITQVDMKEFMKHTDDIFCFAEPDSFSFNSYKKFGKPMYSILPSTSSMIRFSPDWFSTRRHNKFLCFAGNGFICKGVDILVEAFLKMPELELHICGPDSEAAFFEAYGDKIEKAPNINYEGFIKVGRQRFCELASLCSWIILNSAKEGCATSVATCVRAGLIPIVSCEVGISVGDYGFEIDNHPDEIEGTMRTARAAATTSDDEYKRRVHATLIASLNYTQSAFTRSFRKAMLGVMEKM